jgi:citronellyl-CoA dehydrogenase
MAGRFPPLRPADRELTLPNVIACFHTEIRTRMLFTADHEAFRQSARGVLEREVVPHADEWEEAGAFPAHQLFKVLGAAGLLGVEYDPGYGGQGADHSYTVILGEELGRMGCAGVAMAVAVQNDMATPSLHSQGSHELKQRYLAPALRGEMVAAIAVTEPDAGSDVAGIRTTAVRDGDDWVINGSKLYITNGTQADWLCMLARTSDEGGYQGMSQILFPTSAPGFSVSRKLRKLGNNCSDTAELSFTDARVPVSHTIGQAGRGFQQQMQQFQNERMIASYTAVGAMDAALRRTADYLRDRRTFGRPLLSRQYVQFRLAELAAELDTLRHYNYACAEAYLRGEDTTRFATIAKLKAGRLQREVADTCLQFHGGFGYMEETWVSRFFRDSRLLSIGGGADEVMLQILARLDGFTK